MYTSLINATVKYSYKEIETRFGKRINVVLISDRGEEIKQWGEPNDPELTSLKRNQKVTLVKNGDNKYSIVSPSDSPQPKDTEPSQASGNSSRWSEEYKKQLSNEANQLIGLYDYCYKQTKQKMPALESEESVRSIATTIFIQVIRAN